MKELEDINYLQGIDQIGRSLNNCERQPGMLISDLSIILGIYRTKPTPPRNTLRRIIDTMIPIPINSQLAEQQPRQHHT